MRIFTRAVVVFALPLSAWAANLDTAFVSQSVPAEMIAGQSVPVSVTLKNTGVWGWGPSSGHALGSQNPQNNTNWGLSRVPSTVWLGPGSNVTFNFNATAPATPGTYNFQWRMVHDATFGWFGATTPNVAVQVVTPGAEFVSQTVPSAMDPGQTYSVSVTMKNTGSTAWSPGSYKLGSQNPQDNTTWGPSRAELAASVAPGNNGTFTFDVTAPSIPGSYDFQWRMVNSSFGWFGDSSTNVAVDVTSPGAAFVSQTVPSSMTPGQTYQVSVTMENTGASTWTAGSYRLGAANPLDNTTWRATRVELPSSVAPGNNGTFTFDVVAPTTAGAYNFQWRMVFSDYDWFGATSANVQVAVGSASGLDFVHVDHLNTPRLVANGSGTTVWRWDQDEPFGSNVADENPSGLGTFQFPLRFAGTYADGESNLLHNWHRHRDPAIGRNLESDPIGVLGLLSASGALGDLVQKRNIFDEPMSDAADTLSIASELVIDWQPNIGLYAQVRSNPLSFIDPDGRLECLIQVSGRRLRRGNQSRCFDAAAAGGGLAHVLQITQEPRPKGAVLGKNFRERGKQKRMVSQPIREVNIVKRG